jgi:hypothetical protein
VDFLVYDQQYAVNVINKVYDNNFEVDFEISYDDKSKTDTSKIVIWNLAPKTLEALVEKTPIVLYAGWPKSTGILFTGEIVRIETAIAAKGDTPTTIFVAQNRDMWFKSTVNKEWKGPITTKNIVKDIVENSKFSIGFIDDSITFKYLRNWSFNGLLKDALIELAEDCGARVYNEDGRIFFMLPGKSVIQKIRIDSNHLLEAPKKTTEGNWKFTSILRWEGRPGTVITLNSKFLKGEFTALAVKHIRDGDKKFVTEWEVSENDVTKA